MIGRFAIDVFPSAVTVRGALVCLLVALTWIPDEAEARCSVSIDAGEARALAARIWRNESGGDFDKILWWNPGEAFASAGIGHFIWYPLGVRGPFHESFPELLAFLSSRSVPMPGWLEKDITRGSPWSTREEFLDQRNGPEASELRHFLIDTTPLQAEFMIARLESALDKIIAVVPADEARVIESRFCVLAAIPAGRYALVDYVNFKGEGTKLEERYAGQGWGLAQALEEMHGGLPANVDFAEAAARVLERRVRNAHAGNREQRWLRGWLRRVDSYRRH